MSKAFTREDVDPPERSGRVRSPSGLPPGATNYISARGVQRLKDELARIQTKAGKAERVAELESILASVTVVEPPDTGSSDVGFGSTVTIQRRDGETETHTVVGVEELSFEPDAVSWISPLGKSLLAAKLGDRVILGEQPVGKIVKIEYRS